MKTTFKKIKSFEPCREGWQKLIAYYSPNSLDEEISIREILISNGVKDAVWALCAVNDQDKVRLFRADVAESVLHIFEKECPEDDRPRKAIEAIRKFVQKEISKEELKSAAYAADTATYAACTAAAEAAAYTAYAACAAAADTAAYYVITKAVHAVIIAAEAADVITAAIAGTRKWEEIEEILMKYIN